jgi:hypothetical protein
LTKEVEEIKEENKILWRKSKHDRNRGKGFFGMGRGQQGGKQGRKILMRKGMRKATSRQKQGEKNKS